MSAAGVSPGLIARTPTRVRAAARSSTARTMPGASRRPGASVAPLPLARSRVISAFLIIDLSIAGYPVPVAGLLNAIHETFVSLPTSPFR